MSCRTTVRIALAATLLCCSASLHSEQYTVPLFVAPSPGGNPQGVLRLLNNTEAAATVSIHTIDDTGARTGPATLTLNALAAVDLGATDLQAGSAAKGLSAGLGSLSGDVRLVIASDAPILPSAFVRNADGTLSAVNATVHKAAGAGQDAYRYGVAVFHPASNETQPSRLRLINPGDASAQVVIDARDDAGTGASGGTVRLTLPPGGARTLTSGQLEAGDGAVFSGRLGAGVGNWRLSVLADRPIQVVSVAVGVSTGYWSNLSTTAVAGWAPQYAASFEARFLDRRIVSRDGQDRLELRILPGNRFRDVRIADGLEATEEGGYLYERTGREAGRLSIEYDSGERCETNFYFASPTSGWYASACIDAMERVEESTGGLWSTLDAAAAALDLGPGPEDRTYTVGTAIEALTLPAANGGDGVLTYSLSPEVPGLRFEPEARRLTGTPSEVGAWLMMYRVQDASGDTDWRYFNLNVSEGTDEAGSLGTCHVDQTVRIGQSCTYPDTTDAFSVNVRGRGAFLGRLAGIRIDFRNESIDGRVYDFAASHQGDGVWRIDRIGGSTEAPMNGRGGGGADTSPRFSADAAPEDWTYTVGTAIDALTLPAANGGDGTLTYSLSPEVPGLSFNATTRRLTGTPSTAGTYSMTYRVRDSDGDTDSLTFALTVNTALSSEPRAVQLFYVLPSDRPYRQEVVEAIKVTIRQAQTFFSEQMQAHGHPNMTFRVETDGNGEPLVHRVDLEHPDNHYADGAPVDAELPAAGILFMVHDISNASASGGRNNKNRGGATVTAELVLDLSTSLQAGEDTSYASYVVLHELGHAFGLPHDWRDGAYIMSYGGGAVEWDRLSACAADFLSIHPYFNAGVPIEETSPATVGLVSSPAYPTGATSVPVQLQVSDPDGLHQVILLSQGGVKACREMNGKQDAIVEFDYDGYISPATDPNRVGTSLSDPPVHNMEVMVIDAAGDVGGLTFDLFDISAQRNLIGVLEGHGSEVPEGFPRSVTSLAFSPDGAVLASAAINDNIRLWDVTARTTLATLSSRDDTVAFSPDGLLLASGGSDGTVRLWDVAARTIVAELDGHTSPFEGAAPSVNAVEFSPDGSILASGGSDGTVKLWDVAARTEVDSLEGHLEGVAGVAFSPDGATLAAGSLGIKLWDVAARTEVDNFERGRFIVAFSPEGKTLAYREGYNEITLRDAVTWDELTRLEGHTSIVLTLSFSPDGSVLASGSDDATVRLWDVAAQSEIATFSGSGEVESVAFSPDGKILATGSGDGDIRLWDMSPYVTPVDDNGDSDSATLTSTVTVEAGLRR